MEIHKFIFSHKRAAALALAVMIAGTLAYFAYGYDRETFVLMKGSQPKRFMVFHPGEAFSPVLSEGSMGSFQAHYEGSTKICPLLIGAGEAEMMKKEGLFDRAGDRIPGFFGNTVEITGVLAKTGGQLDMFHLVSKDCAYS